MEKHLLYLLLGSNEGNRLQLLQTANEKLAATIGKFIQSSFVYETAAWGKEDQPSFLNQVSIFETSLQPEIILARTQEMENELGRLRNDRWAQRTLDIDILFYDEEIIDLPQLKIPHPEIQNRRFALIPFHEIVPFFWHPVFEKTIDELLEICPDKLPVTIYNLPAKQLDT